MKFPYETTQGFSIVSAKDAVYTCPEKTHLTCTLVIKSGDSPEMEIPFTAHADHPEEHVAEVFKHFKTKAKKYVTPEPTIFDLQSELDELMIDIKLDLATDEEIARAKELRTQIKTMRG